MIQGVGSLAGGRVRGNLYVQTFKCEGSEPCLMYRDQVAGVFRRVGQGSAWLIGTYLGHSATAYRDEEVSTTIRRILTPSGLSPEHAGRLLMRRRCIDNKEAWLLTNPTRETLTEALDVTGWTEVTDLFGSRIQCEGGFIELSVESLDVAGIVVSR